MPDGCYLVNCTGPTGDLRSGVAYYTDFLFNGGNDNTQPQDFVYTAFGQDTKWEGNQQEVTFKDGVKFTWNIESDAQSQPMGANVGSAGNGFRTWSVFKDDDAFMFTNGDNYKCNKIYNVRSD